MSESQAGRMRAAGVRYALAAACVAAALGLSLLQRDLEPTTLLLAAVMVATWFGGNGPGLLAALLATLVVNYYFIPPTRTLALDAKDAPHLVVFAFSALFIGWISAARRRAERGLREARDELDAKVRERTASLAQANEQLQAEIDQRTRAEAELRNSERRYRHIFQTAGVSIWEEDFSRLKAAVDDLKDRGVRDFRAYVAEHPEFVGEAISMVRVVDVNQATLRLFAAESKDELLVSLHEVFVPETREVFVGELTAIAEGRTSFEAETALRTVKGEELTVLFTIAFPPPADRFDSVLVTITDITARKRAEERLRQQADLLEQTHDAIIVWEYPGRIQYWNRGAEQLYGYAADEARGRIVHDLLRTKHPMPFERFKTLIERHPTWSGELTHATRDGREVVVDSRQVLVREGDGRRFVLETNRDVTERKQADEALREREEQWRAAFENNPTMYFMVAEDGTILSVNPFGAEQLGYTVDELVGRSVLDVFYEADREAVRAHAARCIQQLGRTLSWELRKVRKDGTMLSVREAARAMLIKGEPVVLVACEDITERKRAEYLTTQVFECSPDGIAIVGPDYRYRRANQVYERKSGIPPEKLVGMHMAESLGGQRFERDAKPNLERCFAGQETGYSAWIDTADGRGYAVVTFSPLRPDSERVDAALVISRDLTEHMLAAEALREAHAELAHVTRVTMLGEISASIAHEINQPLAAVVMNGNACRRWLAADPPNLDEAREAVQRVVDDGTRAGEVVRRIRSLLQRQVPERSALDVNDIIRDTLALTRSELARHDVSVRAELADNLPSVVGDRVGLEQVLVNLILNGMDAMKGVAESSRALTVRSRVDGHAGVTIEVQDSGVGLAPEQIGRIFEPFVSTKPDGLGMGLAISRSIVEAHGGRLWATPNDGVGVTMRFTLPAEDGGGQ